MSAGFTHLHVHSQYSLLDGAIRIADLLNKCKEYGMDAVALTDHGAMFGALEFYSKAKKAGIKPIIGCELYIAPGDMRVKKVIDGNIAFHIVLLAMNHTGYQNLMKMASIAQFEGFYYKPRIDMEVLRENNEGIIALTACLHGQVPYLIHKNDMNGAREKARELQDIFGDRLYLEMQENGIPDQQPVNDGLKQLSSELGIKLVATNDCHYLNKEEAHAHELLLCIQTGKTINDPNRFRFSTDEFYFKSPETMKKAFAHCPESIETTQEIVDRCDLEINFGDYYFPDFPVKEGESLESMFTTACWEGLKFRFSEMREAGTFSAEVEKTYTERLKTEIDVISTMGFPAYFLIVADFINWAKDNDIPVGPGRGSGAGSLAAYCMRITNIDPIPYGLIFERFLNIERKSMPDFDIDFCQERRGEVIDYVRNKYGGSAHVAQIVTYGSMKARGVIRDVGRALDIPFGEVDKVAKLVPDQLKMTIKKALEEEPKLQEMADTDPRVEELLSVSKTLEGLARHTSTHAAGVVVSPGPMTQYLPTCRGSNEETLTQYDMKHTEMTGLIKFDFLGLKTLTVIDKTVKHIKKDNGIDLNISTIPMDDAKTFDLLCRGDALGVFQLESSGMRELLVKMAPEQFSDLIALVALYRPGPLDSGMVDDFVETKHHRKEAHYPLLEIKHVLEETYGVIVYQEQVMKIANILASYSLGDADILRRAMGKKIPEVMEEEKVKFMTGAEKNNIPLDKAEYIFDLMAKFAGYGFNKSHSAAYALVSYQTAYLKAHYMPQFMTGLLSCDMNNTDKVVLYINECKEHDIEVLPPDINESMKDFSVKNDRVRFGLAAVKNVGESALDSIIEERSQNGPFTSLSDFCNRVDSRRVNSRVIESLVKSGSFDSLGHKRSQYIAILDQAMEQAKAVQRDLQSGQMSLFSVAPETQKQKAMAHIPMPDIPEWDDRDKLAKEKETVGFYITGHPLDNTLPEISSIVDCQIHDLAEKGDDQPVRIGGLIRTFKRHKSKKGDPMAFLTIEDIMESVEVIVFPETYSRCEQVLSSTDPIIVQGVVKKDERGPKIIADSIDSLQEAREKYTESAKIRLESDKLSRRKMELVKEALYTYHGTCPILLTIHFPGRGEVDIEVLKDLTIRPCRELTDTIDDILSYKAVSFTRKPTALAPRKKKWENGNRKPSPR
ncbi:DNA polymerase III subunit alpha [Desulforhopalus singaporensis]|uniref:DNA polymerase III subunit alpha n=1 Tax=Desulforhopalus singaporensis TaxID=91360 RepID=A0A1H0MW34_9BACT|nr:DNA polymerase III subunit alpha [Desulforhopalus singaporensis]SDO84669.1 DNA polymerase III, alpha subunit [Desulforhopalus singaporensis]